MRESEVQLYSTQEGHLGPDSDFYFLLFLLLY